MIFGAPNSIDCRYHVFINTQVSADQQGRPYSVLLKHTQTCLVFGEQWLVQSPKLFFLRPMRERERERERGGGGGGEIQTDSCPRSCKTCPANICPQRMPISLEAKLVAKNSGTRPLSRIQGQRIRSGKVPQVDFWVAFPRLFGGVRLFCV